MALEVYVGNFPSTFTRDDLLNLFQDFKSIQIMRMKNLNNKCFAFFQCQDEHQVVDVVTTMHDIDVCGRNLIVRSTNQELQNLIIESLQENDVLDKHPRNTHHSQYYNSSNRIIDVKNFIPGSIDEVVPDFPVGVRFKNPRLESYAEKNDLVHLHQQKYRSPSNAYPYKSPNQSKYANESSPYERNLPIYDPGVSKSNDSSQNLSQPSSRPEAKAQDFPDEGAGRQNFVNSTTASNTKFNDPCLQSLHVESKNSIDLQRPGCQLLNAHHVKSNPKACDFQNPSRWNSFNHGTEELKHNSSFQNLGHAQGFSNEGAITPKCKQQYNEFCNPGKSNFDCQKDNGHTTLSAYREVDSTCQSESFDGSTPQKKMFCVSVVNFPLSTTIEDLYDLFEDFDPQDIIMICNSPLKNRRPTEAIVYLQSEDQVTDAIINFDNTIYNKRVLTVTDPTEISLITDLLNLRSNKI